MALPKIPTGLSTTLRKFLEYLRGEDWHNVGDTGEPAFQNQWQNYTTTTIWADCQFKKVGTAVHIRGLIETSDASTGLNTNIFVLPEGYRPSLNSIFITICNGGNIGQIQIQSDGSVRLATVGTGAVWLSLNYLIIDLE